MCLKVVTHPMLKQSLNLMCRLLVNHKLFKFNFSALNRNILKSKKLNSKIFSCGLLAASCLKSSVSEVHHRHGNSSVNGCQTAQVGLFKTYTYKIWSFLRAFIRACRVLLLFLPVLSMYPFLFWNPSLKNIWWKLVLLATEFCGPVFLKLAQWASARRDLFSVEFCDNLSHLQRRTKPHSWTFTKIRLQQSFGKKWREIFVKFDNNRLPVGSGCVAQVYKAYVKPEIVSNPELLNEIVDASDDNSCSFVEGIEVIGFGHLFGTGDKELDEAEIERRNSRVNREIDRIKLDFEYEHSSCENSADGSAEDFEQYSKSLLLEKINDVDVSSDDLEGFIPVAVKVLHPQIHTQFYRDIMVLKSFANFLEFFVPSLRWLSLHECVDEFGRLMEAQLDLRIEANCLETFSENFKNIGNIRFPTPVWPFVTKSVLVETFEEGEPLSTFMRTFDESDPNTPSNEIKSRIAEMGLNMLLKMVFTDNFFHGDLHPGNIMIQNYEPYVGPESSSEDSLLMLDICDTLIVRPQVEKFQRLRMIVLDCGVAATLHKDDWNKLLNVFIAVVKGKGDEVASLFLKQSEQNRCSDPEKFKDGMNNIVKKAHHDRLTLETTDVVELLHDVFSLLQDHHIKLESNFASVILAVLVLEGVGRTLDPDIDIIKMTQPYLFK